MYIRDPIYGNVEFDDTALKIIEDSNMQRLRYIHQIGFAFLVYPGATHTRFEHSIGTMQATREMESAIWDSSTEDFIYMGLLHDIGHGPFSHQSEPLLQKYLKTDHEGMGRKVITQSSIRDTIAASNASLKRVLGYFNGKTNNIVSAALGSDRVDYLLRDSYYTGVAYGAIDFQRIKSKVTMYRGMVALHSEGVSAAEALLVARYFMFENVYGHHTQVIAGAMFAKAAENAIQSGDMDPREFARMNDYEAMSALARIDESAELIKRIQERHLFKRVYDGEINGETPKKDEIRDALELKGISENEYVALTYDFKPPNAGIPVVNRDGSLAGDLSTVSPLVKMLTNTLSKKKMLIIATDRKYVERAKSAINRLI
ncbi:MAG: HD domain-containing protein [Candidatus Micrarchaeia archaeon]